MFNNTKKLKAFTMAEAILVMTVLGIIATIMITTLRPSEFQEKGLQILAKKVLSEIDTATSNVLFNDSADSTFDHLYENGSTNMFTVADTSANGGEATIKLIQLYKKYMITTRNKPTRKTTFVGTNDEFYLVLKNGAEMGIKFYKIDSYVTIFPGETNTIHSSCPYGFIYFDINGKDSPNVMGKDAFVVPLDKTGIKYD